MDWEIGPYEKVDEKWAKERLEEVRES